MSAIFYLLISLFAISGVVALIVMWCALRDIRRSDAGAPARWSERDRRWIMFYAHVWGWSLVGPIIILIVVGVPAAIHLAILTHENDSARAVFNGVQYQMERDR